MSNKTLLCLFVFLALSIQGFSSSPRLLITLGPKCNFNAEWLQKQIDAVIVNETEKKLENKILELDRSSSCHIVILKRRLRDMPSLSRKVGYASLRLNGNSKACLKIVNEVIASMPLTDADLPRMDPLVVGLFYDLITKINQVFQKSDLRYWCTCGTLLGIVRHQGIIPWDDDIDLAIFEKDIPILLDLESALSEIGLKISYHPRFEFYKIYFKDGEPIHYEDGTKCPWTFPFVDIFPLTELDGRLIYAGKLWQEYYAKQDYYLPEELQFPLETMPFGPVELPVPQCPVDYIQRVYGSDWNDVAYITFSHRCEKIMKKIKVDLTDRSPAKYELPNAASAISE